LRVPTIVYIRAPSSYALLKINKIIPVFRIWINIDLALLIDETLFIHTKGTYIIYYGIINIKKIDAILTNWMRMYLALKATR
jgi:hypothetical protein